MVFGLSVWLKGLVKSEEFFEDIQYKGFGSNIQYTWVNPDAVKNRDNFIFNVNALLDGANIVTSLPKQTTSSRRENRELDQSANPNFNF